MPPGLVLIVQQSKKGSARDLTDADARVRYCHRNGTLACEGCSDYTQTGRINHAAPETNADSLREHDLPVLSREAEHHQPEDREQATDDKQWWCISHVIHRTDEKTREDQEKGLD